jgi:hypothetical protein
MEKLRDFIGVIQLTRITAEQFVDSSSIGNHGFSVESKAANDSSAADASLRVWVLSLIPVVPLQFHSLTSIALP